MSSFSAHTHTHTGCQCHPRQLTPRPRHAGKQTAGALEPFEEPAGEQRQPAQSNHKRGPASSAARLGLAAGPCNSIQLKSCVIHSSPRADVPGDLAILNAIRAKITSLGHILQMCAHTWAQKNERHDTFVNEVGTILKQKKYEVLVEPRILTSAGIRKNDIVA